jgi:hypothetical protein
MAGEFSKLGTIRFAAADHYAHALPLRCLPVMFLVSTMSEA